jgi:tetratricopeptide (TPR) repeat protein
VTELDRSALEAERDFLLRSISDLDAEAAAGDLNDADYTALRDDYVARAAAVTRALETPVAMGSAAVTAPASPRRRRGYQAVVAIAVALVLATVAGVLLAQSSGSRRSGEAATGSLPENVSQKLDAALDDAQKGKVVESLKAIDALLKANPNNPELLAYRGWILYNTGQLPDQAITYVERAIAADPTYPDAHFFRGLMIWKSRGDPQTAVSEFRLFLSNNPPENMVSSVEAALQEAMADAANPSTTTTQP